MDVIESTKNAKKEIEDTTGDSQDLQAQCALDALEYDDPEKAREDLMEKLLAELEDDEEDGT